MRLDLGLDVFALRFWGKWSFSFILDLLNSTLLVIDLYGPVPALGPVPQIPETRVERLPHLIKVRTVNKPLINQRVLPFDHFRYLPLVLGNTTIRSLVLCYRLKLQYHSVIVFELLYRVGRLQVKCPQLLFYKLQDLGLQL